MKVLSIVIAAVVALGLASGGARAEQVEPTPPAVAAGNQSIRKICTDAMNADPTFAKSIVEFADKEAAERRMAATEAEHISAGEHIAKDQKHVILAYGAMWLIAAGFVVFLWRRQQALKAEIAQLRSDLEKEAAT